MANSGSGFGRTVDRSERHQHSSWGRTRGPKNITGPNQTPVAVTDCGSLVAAAAGTGVCVTENQRYLHITTAAGASVSNIWAYMHASKPVSYTHLRAHETDS